VEERKLTPEEFRLFISNLMNYKMIPFLYEKNKKYGGSSLEGGKSALVGNMFRQKDKFQRLENLVNGWMKNGLDTEIDAPFGESIYDTISDQLGYALLGMTVCAREGLAPFTVEEMLELEERLTAKVEFVETPVESPTYTHGYQPELDLDFEGECMSNLGQPDMIASSIFIKIIGAIAMTGSNQKKILEDLEGFIQENLNR